jgi:hypothetical protein
VDSKVTKYTWNVQSSVCCDGSSVWPWGGRKELKESGSNHRHGVRTGTESPLRFAMRKALCRVHCTTDIKQALSSTAIQFSFRGIWFLNESLRGQILNDDRYRLGDVQLVRLEVNFWARWSLVGGRDTGEFLKTQDCWVSIRKVTVEGAYL